MLHDSYRFDAYLKAAEQFTVSQAVLMGKGNAAAEIDRVLTDCITLVRASLLYGLYNVISLSSGSSSLSDSPDRSRLGESLFLSPWHSPISCTPTQRP
jgi:TPP-dependent 2-oxoacid decarboxylase